ncbi:MAG: VOC family protein [Proteobacteria bacterium]|nr:VOC family protein [Pseudomonadota bacterium]
MLDHIGFPVANFLHSKRFYQAVLEPLGIGIVMEVTAEQTGGSSHAGFGEDGKPYFWIGDGEGTLHGRFHIAFAAKKRADVDAFHKAALAMGGRDNGKPGLRPHYHEHYYAAFVFDPDGHNIEAVCHAPA